MPTYVPTVHCATAICYQSYDKRVGPIIEPFTRKFVYIYFYKEPVLHQQVFSLL